MNKNEKGQTGQPTFSSILLIETYNMITSISHQAELITVMQLIQGGNNVNRMQVKPRSFDQSQIKTNAFSPAATLPIHAGNAI